MRRSICFQSTVASTWLLGTPAASMRAVWPWRSTSVSPARVAAVARALLSWQMPPPMVGTTQPSRISRPSTKPLRALMWPSCCQKLSMAPAGSSTPSKAAMAWRRLCTLPATSANSSLRPSLHNGLRSSAITGACASGLCVASTAGQRRTAGERASCASRWAVSSRMRSQNHRACLREGRVKGVTGAAEVARSGGRALMAADLRREAAHQLLEFCYRVYSLTRSSIASSTCQTDKPCCI